MRRSALHYIPFGAALGFGVPLVFRLASIALESYAGARDVMWTVFDNHGIRRARRSYLDGHDEVSFNPGVSLIDSRRCLVCNMAHLVHSNSAPHRDGREASHFDQPSSVPARGRERSASA